MKTANWLIETAHWVFLFSNGCLLITGSNPLSLIANSYIEDLVEELIPYYMVNFHINNRNESLISNGYDPLEVRVLPLDIKLQELKE